jgi:hypothetical protein
MRLGAVLEPPDMQAAMGEVDGVPAQRHQLSRPQPVPVARCRTAMRRRSCSSMGSLGLVEAGDHRSVTLSDTSPLQ